MTPVEICAVMHMRIPRRYSRQILSIRYSAHYSEHTAGEFRKTSTLRHALATLMLVNRSAKYWFCPRHFSPLDVMTDLGLLA